MTDPNKRKEFIRGDNGKVRNVRCPYAKMYDDTVRLTAEEYRNSKRCLCNYCWQKKPEYYWIETYAWE